VVTPISQLTPGRRDIAPAVLSSNFPRLLKIAQRLVTGTDQIIHAKAENAETLSVSTGIQLYALPKLRHALLDTNTERVIALQAPP